MMLQSVRLDGLEVLDDFTEDKVEAAGGQVLHLIFLRHGVACERHLVESSDKIEITE